MTVFNTSHYVECVKIILRADMQFLFYVFCNPPEAYSKKTLIYLQVFLITAWLQEEGQ